MKNMIKRQQGITFISIVIILAVLGFFVLITLRLFPLYNEKFTVVAAMKSAATRPDADKMSENDILQNFVRTVQVGGSNRFNNVNVKKMASVEKGADKKTRVLHVKFEQTNKFFDDIQFILMFDKSVEIKSGGSGE